MTFYCNSKRKEKLIFYFFPLKYFLSFFLLLFCISVPSLPFFSFFFFPPLSSSPLILPFFSLKQLLVSPFFFSFLFFFSSSSSSSSSSLAFLFLYSISVSLPFLSSSFSSSLAYFFWLKIKTEEIGDDVGVSWRLSQWWCGCLNSIVLKPGPSD